MYLLNLCEDSFLNVNRFSLIYLLQQKYEFLYTGLKKCNSYLSSTSISHIFDTPNELQANVIIEIF